MNSFQPRGSLGAAVAPTWHSSRVGGRLLLFGLALGWLTMPCATKSAYGQAAPAADSYCELRVVDPSTGQGVPLVELTTVNGLRFVTDNAGRVAFHEPGLMDRELFLTVKSHGYEAEADGFGYHGVRLTPRAGERIEIPVMRTMLAERLCRLTGEGCYRDSLLLGREVPLRQPLGTGLVAGQDSVQAIEYDGRTYWFWGDTSRMSYPLGLFRVAGATTPRFDPTGPEPRGGIEYEYFVDDDGFARAMMPLPSEPKGVVWILSLFTLPDPSGRERLLAWYTHRLGLADEVGQGIALFNDEQRIFEPLVQLPIDEPWRRPSGHPIRYREGDREWLLFGSPTPNVRVEATWEAATDPTRYEALTCRREDGRPGIERDPSIENRAERACWRWQTTLDPVDSKQEHEWLGAGFAERAELRFSPADAAHPEDRIQLHSGTVRWNEYRQKWILIAGQIHGGPSYLGEVWYSEADDPTGPFERAVRIATHDRQTFYNVCHHAFLDREDGRYVYFEGTYTRDFSGNEDATPRYNYNQVLYRLDLADERLRVID